MNLDKVDTLIFDLGGVIINLNIENTIKALAGLGDIDAEEMLNKHWQHPVFHQYEMGQCSDSEFRSTLKDLLQVNASDQALDEVWNAMILDIPADRLRLLKSLKNRYKLFLLSNTNNIHLRRVDEVFVPLADERLDSYFHGSYYSHQMGMRKPNKDIFEKVISDNHLNPDTAVFFDDTEHNITGARHVGLQTFWVKHPDEIKALFNAEKI